MLLQTQTGDAEQTADPRGRPVLLPLLGQLFGLCSRRLKTPTSTCQCLSQEGFVNTWIVVNTFIHVDISRGTFALWLTSVKMFWKVPIFFYFYFKGFVFFSFSKFPNINILLNMCLNTCRSWLCHLPSTSDSLLIFNPIHSEPLTASRQPGSPAFQFN